MFTIDLAAELKDKGIVVQSLHPATYMNTSMILSAGLTPRSTVEEGTAAVMNAITTDAPSGSFFVGQKPGTPHAQAATPTRAAACARSPGRSSACRSGGPPPGQAARRRHHVSRDVRTSSARRACSSVRSRHCEATQSA